MIAKLQKGNKGRITLTLSPQQDEIEQKVMRSVVSANFGERIWIRHKSHPSVEIKLEVDNPRRVNRKWYAPASTAPDATIIKNENALDEDEVKAAYRTIKAHALLKSLGGKLPASIAKKFECRCGLFFVVPGEFLGHRRICPVINKEEAELFVRAPKPPEIEAKEKEIFECRCGSKLHSKRQLTKHQKKCSVLHEEVDVFAQGKAYLARQKRRDESAPRKKKGTKKKVNVGNRVHNKVAKREQRRKKVA